MAGETNLDLDLDRDGARVTVVDVQGYTRQGDPTITISCESYAALEREVERLKGELQDITERARSFFEGGASDVSGTVQDGREHPEAAAAKPQLDASLSVADLMTRDVKTVQRNDRISVAGELMKAGRFRHVVVLEEDGRLAGVVSHRDIVYGAVAWTLGQGRAAHDKALESYPVKDVMTASVTTIDSAAPLRDAAALMTEHKLGCLPVVDGGVLVGVLTEGDFLYLLAG